MTTYTSQPDDTTGYDIFIDNSTPTITRETDDILGIGEYNAGAAIIRTLIKFDLSSIPAGSTITNATLSLWYKTDLSSNTRNAKVYRILRDWLESQATWNVWKTANNWTTAGAGSNGNDADLTNVWATASMVHNATPNTELQWVFDATGITELQKIINGTYTNYGWLMKADTETDDLWYFHSSSSTTAGYRPKLVIEYTPPFIGSVRFF